MKGNLKIDGRLGKDDVYPEYTVEVSELVPIESLDGAESLRGTFTVPPSVYTKTVVSSIRVDSEHVLTLQDRRAAQILILERTDEAFTFSGTFLCPETK
jgi:hypothetical protein